ncbi:hypothetical protein J2I47_12690 [Fibrella sp. HMF5335]|uniref:Uncharacterized protein n=1 Tax=Fibrella rubiginis TaxID=2817060 RepID=A0A939K6D2_9BACT|nr:hypothetical protein [Fibrella rubiginis]MBO0937405.1 hypothetical protein [Fibrella rubiginis]
MITTNEKRPLRSLKRSTLLIGCLLLLLLGGVYWQRKIATEPAPVLAKASKVEKPALENRKAALNNPLTVKVNADSAQSLPTDLSVNKIPVIKRMTKLSKVRYEAARTYVPVLSETSTSVEREPAPVAQPAAVAPVVSETRPRVTESAPISQPAELKPVVQPIPVAAAVTSPVSTSVPMPITASAAPLPKRKAKNDEDVEIDPE